MIGTDKIRKGIECCIKTADSDGCRNCPYRDDYSGFPRRNYGETSCVSKLLSDINTMMKPVVHCGNCKFAEFHRERTRNEYVCIKNADKYGRVSEEDLKGHPASWTCSDGEAKPSKREKVIKGLECCTYDHGMCSVCPYDTNLFEFVTCERNLINDTFELVKEQQSNIEYWSAKYDEMGKQYMTVRDERDELLKVHEAIVPTLDEKTKRFYRCGVCGEYVGFIDSDPGDPDEKDNYCRNCGKPVKWE